MDKGGADIFQQLIALADEALAPDIGPDEIVSRIDHYVTTFTTLSQNLSEAAPEEKVSELQRKHHAVLSRAESLKSATAQEITTLHKKAQGLLSYIDTFPKRISARKITKG